MLENTEGKRIACIVNDMAEVNIDAALIRGNNNALAQAPEELVQLQNGCALCVRSCAVELIAPLSSPPRGHAQVHLLHAAR
jgi:G3E family GTPase